MKLLNILKFLMISACSVGLTAQAQVSEPNVSNIGFAAEILYLSQDSGGNTATVLPLLSGHLWSYSQFSLNLEAGGTVYKDADTDETFGILALQVIPSYKIAGTPFAVEAILGVQHWESFSDTKSNLGLRIVSDLHENLRGFLDEAYLGAGYIDHDEPVTHYSFGLRKWF